jgi:glycosyltransferase involved in cell wall biosynthesis
VGAISAGLEQLMNDGGLRDRLIARGLERAARFSWEKSAEQTWNVYQGLLI